MEIKPYVANMKETYEIMKFLLQNEIQYEEHKWNICGDLKDVAVLFGIQLGHIVLLLSL